MPVFGKDDWNIPDSALQGQELIKK